MIPSYLVTHSGGFHADEVFSSVILTRLFPKAQLIRSRAKEWITPGSDKIIYDVGGNYDLDIRIFDHHQRGAPLRDDGQPFSSFGLIWRHFGRDYLTSFDVPEKHVEALHASLDTKFVLPIDLLDNGAVDPGGIGPLSALLLPELIESLKPVFDDTDADAEARSFQTALTIARTFLEARISRSVAKLRAEAIVMQAIAEAGDGRILELPMGMPFRPAIKKARADHLWFVINPRGSDWVIGGIRKSEDGFEQRADLPAAWAGLTGAELEAASGVPGALFCHNARFIAAAASREAALAMARIAVDDAELNRA